METVREDLQPKDPSIMKVLSVTHVRGHIYHVVTESPKYGVVSQNVVVFPPSLFEEHPATEQERASSTVSSRVASVVSKIGEWFARVSS